MIVDCTLCCGAWTVGMRVGACTLSYGVGTGDGVSVEIGGRGMGDGMGAGRVVSQYII